MHSPDQSLAARLAALNPEALAGVRHALGPSAWAAVQQCWVLRARPAQLPPPGDWRIWLIQAGRGFGKTRAGAEWIDAMARAHPGTRLALVGATIGDVRDVMVEGESGILNLSGAGIRPLWRPSLARLIWPNGAMAVGYSAADPESLRGSQHHFAWADEVGRWNGGKDGSAAVAAFDNLMLGLRRGCKPRLCVTTTPRAVPLMKRLATMPGVVRTRGRTDDNAAHLPASWLAAMRADYAGTRLERQELDGELIADIEGALFSRALIEASRWHGEPPDEAALLRVVVGVDPPAGVDGDACGIVVAALTGERRLLVLADASVSGATPGGWAAAVAAAAHRFRADRIIAEANNGGAMVEAVLRAADAALPVRLVHASRGKATRAEPIEALYEQGRVAHVGPLAALEDELCGLLRGGGYAGPGRSPDRADALVWALTELTRGTQAAGQGPGVRTI